MEVLGGEFGDMTPQELAAPVNTVAVSLGTVGQMRFHHEQQDCLMYWQKESLHFTTSKTVSDKTHDKLEVKAVFFFIVCLFSNRKNGNYCLPS